MTPKHWGSLAVIAVPGLRSELLNANGFERLCDIQAAQIVLTLPRILYIIELAVSIDHCKLDLV